MIIEIFEKFKVDWRLFLVIKGPVSVMTIQTTGSKIKRERIQFQSEEDWNLVKNTIQELYDNNMTSDITLEDHNKIMILNDKSNYGYRIEKV